MNMHLREKSMDDLFDVLIKGIGVDGLEARVTYDECHHVRSGGVD